MWSRTGPQVLDMRESEGEIQYLIKWRNFPASYNSWEDSAELGRDLINLAVRFWRDRFA